MAEKEHRVIEWIGRRKQSNEDGVVAEYDGWWVDGYEFRIGDSVRVLVHADQEIPSIARVERAYSTKEEDEKDIESGMVTVAWFGNPSKDAGEVHIAYRRKAEERELFQLEERESVPIASVVDGSCQVIPASNLEKAIEEVARQEGTTPENLTKEQTEKIYFVRRKLAINKRGKTKFRFENILEAADDGNKRDKQAEAQEPEEESGKKKSGKSSATAAGDENVRVKENNTAPKSDTPKKGQKRKANDADGYGARQTGEKRSKAARPKTGSKGAQPSQPPPGDNEGPPRSESTPAPRTLEPSESDKAGDAHANQLPIAGNEKDQQDKLDDQPAAEIPALDNHYNRHESAANEAQELDENLTKTSERSDIGEAVLPIPASVPPEDAAKAHENPASQEEKEQKGTLEPQAAPEATPKATQEAKDAAHASQSDYNPDQKEAKVTDGAFAEAEVHETPAAEKNDGPADAKPLTTGSTMPADEDGNRHPEKDAEMEEKEPPNPNLDTRQLQHDEPRKQGSVIAIDEEHPRAEHGGRRGQHDQDQVEEDDEAWQPLLVTKSDGAAGLGTRGVNQESGGPKGIDTQAEGKRGRARVQREAERGPGLGAEALPAVEGVRMLADGLYEGLGPAGVAKRLADSAWKGIASLGGTRAVVIGRAGVGRTRIVNELAQWAMQPQTNSKEANSRETETAQKGAEVRVVDSTGDVKGMRVDQLPACDPDEAAGTTGFILPEDPREGTCVPAELRFGERLRAVLIYEDEPAVQRIVAPLIEARRRGKSPPMVEARRARAALGLPADADPNKVGDVQALPQKARSLLGKEVWVRPNPGREVFAQAAQLRGILARVTRGTGSCWGCLKRIIVEVPCGGSSGGLGAVVDLPARMDGRCDSELEEAACSVVVTDERKLDGEVRRALSRAGFLRALVANGSGRALLMLCRGGESVKARRWDELAGMLEGEAGAEGDNLGRALSRCSVVDCGTEPRWQTRLVPEIAERGAPDDTVLETHTRDALDAAEALACCNQMRARALFNSSGRGQDALDRDAAVLAKVGRSIEEGAGTRLLAELEDWGEEAAAAAGKAASYVLGAFSSLETIDDVRDAVAKAAREVSSAMKARQVVRERVVAEAVRYYVQAAESQESEDVGRDDLADTLRACAEEAGLTVRAAFREAQREAAKAASERAPEAAKAAAETVEQAGGGKKVAIEAALRAAISCVREECLTAMRSSAERAVNSCIQAAGKLRSLAETRWPPSLDKTVTAQQEVHKCTVEIAGALCLKDKLAGALGDVTRRDQAARARMDGAALEGAGRSMQPEELVACASGSGSLGRTSDRDTDKPNPARGAERANEECPELRGVPPRPWREAQAACAVRAMRRIFGSGEKGAKLAAERLKNASPHPVHAISEGDQSAALAVPEHLAAELLGWLKRRHFLATSPSLGSKWHCPLANGQSAARAAASAGLPSAKEARDAIKSLRERFGPGARGFTRAAAALGTGAGDMRSNEAADHTQQQQQLDQGSGSIGAECDRAAVEGLDFLERECVGGERFGSFGSDLVVTAAFFLRVGEPDTPPRAAAERLARGAALRWWRENASAGAEWATEGEGVFYLAEGLAGLMVLRQHAPPSIVDVLPSHETLSQLRSALSAKASGLDAGSFVPSDVVCNRLPRATGGWPDFRKLSEALVSVYFLRLAGLALPTGVPPNPPTHLAEQAKPYQPERVLGTDLFKEQVYLVTHLIFIQSGWCHLQLDAATLSDESRVLEKGLERAVSLGDVDLAGECLQALLCLGYDTSQPPLSTGRSFLLSAQDRLTGGWDASTPSFDKRYHATVCAVGGLMPHAFRGSAPFTAR